MLTPLRRKWQSAADLINKDMGNVMSGYYDVPSSGRWYFALTAYDAVQQGPSSDEVFTTVGLPSVGTITAMVV